MLDAAMPEMPEVTGGAVPGVSIVYETTKNCRDYRRQFICYIPYWIVGLSNQR